MSGWIKLHREIFDSDIWHDVTTFRLFIYLIGKASHQDGIMHKGMILNRGQYVRSYRKLADDLSYKEGRGSKKHSLSTIKKCVSKLVEAKRVNVEETKEGTLFTIVNYAKYQDLGDTKKETMNTIKDEVRTNGELTGNEVRTNGEQEQELKNLRIKEFDSTTTTTPEESISEIIQTFESSLCRLSPMQIKSLCEWFDELNGNKEIILEAIKIADDRNKRSFGFVEYLLKEWSNNNLTNIEQIQTHERNKFQKPIRNFGSGKKPIRSEIVPSWLQEQQQEEEPNQSSIVDLEAERARLLAIQEKYKKAEQITERVY